MRVAQLPSSCLQGMGLSRRDLDLANQLSEG